MTRPIPNFVLFQLCWLANCLGAGNGVPLIGPVATAVWISLHLYAVGEGRIQEGLLLLAAAALGFAADSVLVLNGLIGFPGHARLGGPSSVWMVALWVGFAATLRHALRWLDGRYLLGGLLGALGGPLAYRAGEALDAIRIADTAAGLAAVSGVWLLAMPLLLALAAFLRPKTRIPRRAGEPEQAC